MNPVFSPITLGQQTIKNRLVMPPMCTYASDTSGLVNDYHIHHYAARAMGGIGLIIVEATGVQENGKITDQCLGIYGDEHIHGLSQLVTLIKHYGAVPGIQLAHAGRKSTVTTCETIHGVTNQGFNDTYTTPTAMTQDDLDELVRDFGRAGLRAQQAGFELVEIHGAHGYLLNSFLSPLTNTRTDAYGGSTENRAKLLIDILTAVKANFKGTITLRINAHDHKAGGLTPEEAAAILNLAKTHGLDGVDVSSGGLIADPDYKAYPGHQLPMAATVKALTGLPVIGGGMITQATHIHHIIQSDQADMVFLGRPLLMNPNFPLQLAEELGVTPDWPFTPKALKSMGKWNAQ